MTRKRDLSLPFMAGRSVKLGLALIQCGTFVSSIVKCNTHFKVSACLCCKEMGSQLPGSFCYQRKLQGYARWTRKDPEIYRSLQT